MGIFSHGILAETETVITTTTTTVVQTLAPKNWLDAIMLKGTDRLPSSLYWAVFGAIAAGTCGYGAYALFSFMRKVKEKKPRRSRSASDDDEIEPRADDKTLRSQVLTDDATILRLSYMLESQESPLLFQHTHIRNLYLYNYTFATPSDLRRGIPPDVGPRPSPPLLPTHPQRTNHGGANDTGNGSQPSAPLFLGALTGSVPVTEENAPRVEDA